MVGSWALLVQRLSSLEASASPSSKSSSQALSPKWVASSLVGHRTLLVAPQAHNSLPASMARPLPQEPAHPTLALAKGTLAQLLVPRPLRECHLACLVCRTTRLYSMASSLTRWAHSPMVEQWVMVPTVHTVHSLVLGPFKVALDINR